MPFRNRLLSVAFTTVILLAGVSSTTLEAKTSISTKIATYTPSNNSNVQSMSQTSKRKMNVASSAVQQKVVKVRLSTQEPIVGETMTIHVDNAKKVTASVVAGFQPVFFMDETGTQTALLPISYATQPGTYNLSIVADGKEYKYNLAVTARKFEEQYLTVDPETTKNTAGSTDANNEWTRRVEPLKLVSDSKKYWKDSFIMPVEGDLTGRITTEYGSIRYTNGSTVASRHSGIDIAMKTGTPVLATGSGRILFADFLQLTGYTVIIEHGYGLKSLYYHMDSVNVKEGDMVEQGAQIGAVGSTGFSTGPHCHFAMAVNNVFTNPWTLIKQGL